MACWEGTMDGGLAAGLNITTQHTAMSTCIHPRPELAVLPRSLEAQRASRKEKSVRDGEETDVVGMSQSNQRH